uniref:EamA domain-containing protein n=1 Tax=Opuntia streptacantha TaxID=393608 RepID=A0A7C8Z8B8_OPUST
MRSEVWNWTLGVIYIVAVAAIWIASSYVVQSVVDAGISPFLITYICNSLFVIYIPLVEAGRLLEDYTGKLCFWQRKTDVRVQKLANLEQAILLEKSDLNEQSSRLRPDIYSEQEDKIFVDGGEVDEAPYNQLDAKGRWSRTRVAKVSLLICPFWFLAQLTFNLSLKYTTVTSNTILSTSSSLFTFLLSLAFLGEKFSWVKLIGVLLCMGGTIIVSFGDSEMGLRGINSNPMMRKVGKLVWRSFWVSWGFSTL